MSQSKPFLQRFVRFWWVQLPFRASRFSSKLPFTFLDGLYMAAWPAVAAWAPLLVTDRRSCDRVVAPGIRKCLQRIVVVLMIAAIVGISSANLGLLFIVGFIFGDFFLHHTSWTAGRMAAERRFF